MLALEYVAKFLIYLIVIVVVVGVIWKFFVSTKVCFINCEKPTEQCDIETKVVYEERVTNQIIDKYCSLCWQSVQACRKNVLCYVVNLNVGFDPKIGITSGYDYCEVKCNKQATSLLFEYDWAQRKVLVEC